MITKKGAELAFRKRKDYKPSPIILRSDFDQQNNFVNDNSRFIAAQCSRRSGKTNGLALRFFRTMEKYPNSQCIYIALTFESARDIMIPVLKELNEAHGIGCTFTESEMRHPNGSKLKIVGADLKNFIKRLKGRKYPGVAIDEAQDFGSHIESLVNDVLTPSISDYTDGWIAVTGTPGPAPQGYFFEVTNNGKFGYSIHKWTMLDNPYHPDTESFLSDLKNRQQWGDDNPTYRREYKNEWVLDVKSIWIQYDAQKNHYQGLPKLPDNAAWNYILGIDIGFKDADALAVLAWSEHTPTTYLVEEMITSKQGLTELAEQVQGLQKKYDISKMVIDEGGLGKKLAEEMRRRWHIPVQPAEKHRKQETVDIFNDAMRLSHFMAKSNSRFAQDSYLVQIDWDKSTPSKIVIKKNPHSDIIDAVLYAFKESPAFTYQPPAPKHKQGTREWYDQQREEMFEMAKEAALAEQEWERRLNGEE